jgi:hypothetical protein
MEFLKKHYEKIILGVVLAGLVGALVFMPIYIGTDNQNLADLTGAIINPTAKELDPVDLSAQTLQAARVHSPYKLDLDTTNKVFNPRKWVRTQENFLTLEEGHTGVEVVVVTNIAPLYLIIQLDAVTTNELGARYVFSVEKQAAPLLADRRKRNVYVAQGDTKANKYFSLLSVKGAAESPEELTIKLVDTGDLIPLTREKAFRRIEGYTAGFRYDPEKRTFKSKRSGDKVAFNGTDFLVDDVKENELILQDQSNQKKTSRPFTP